MTATVKLNDQELVELREATSATRVISEGRIGLPELSLILK